jgi:hypothetical protein
VSVTTILQCVAKEALPYWAAKVTAEHALSNLPLLVKSARRKPCEMKGDDRCGLCTDCVALDLRRAPDRERDAAADRGSRIHHVADQHTLTGEVIGHDADIAEQVNQYLAFKKQFKPTFDASEMTVISRQYGFGGTLDAILRLGWCPPKYADLVGKPQLTDVKSGKSCYPEYALQLAAYKHCDFVLLPDGTELPMPKTHDIGLLLHVRPDNYWVRPVDIGETTFAAFLAVLDLWRWQQDTSPIMRAMYKPGQSKSDDPAELRAVETEAKRQAEAEALAAFLAEPTAEDEPDCCTTGSCAGHVADDPFRLIPPPAIPDSAIPF